ncbi:hypothetical protein Ddc_11079 [Ditylenchus destructor]|nr:hypothetical protein Ddc_11079 [Ditylenchus destructor]
MNSSSQIPSEMEYVKYLNLGSDITIVVLHATTIFFTFHVVYCSKFDKKSTKLDRISNSFFIFLVSRGFGAVIATPYYVYLTVYWSAEAKRPVPALIASEKGNIRFFHLDKRTLSQKRTCHFLRRTVPLSQKTSTIFSGEHVPLSQKKTFSFLRRGRATSSEAQYHFLRTIHGEKEKPIEKNHQKRARSSLRKRRSSPRMLPDEKRLNS